MSYCPFSRTLLYGQVFEIDKRLLIRKTRYVFDNLLDLMNIKNLSDGNLPNPGALNIIQYKLFILENDA